MKQNYLSRGELEWAISIVLSEHPEFNKDNPDCVAIAQCVSKEFAVDVPATQVQRFFAELGGDDLEREQRRITYGYDLY